jgi:8-oxo-dGTP diphosphatase
MEQNKNPEGAAAQQEKLKMVVGFMFNEKETDVLLIEKQKPAWQKGLLNGIGGKVEPHETFAIAMCREFQEETGIAWDDWRYVTTMSGEDWEVQVFSAKTDDVFDFKQMENEAPLLIPINELDKYAHVSNLQWLIPMCLDVKRIDYLVTNNNAPARAPQEQPAAYDPDPEPKMNHWCATLEDYAQFENDHQAWKARQKAVPVIKDYSPNTINMTNDQIVDAILSEPGGAPALPSRYQIGQPCELFQGPEEGSIRGRVSAVTFHEEGAVTYNVKGIDHNGLHVTAKEVSGDFLITPPNVVPQD